MKLHRRNSGHSNSDKQKRGIEPKQEHHDQNRSPCGTFQESSRMGKVSRLPGMIAVALLILFVSFARPNRSVEQTNGESTITSKESTLTMSPWREGYLGIHHLRVGPSVSSFYILPDETTVLVDAGAVDLTRKLPLLWKRGHEGLQIHPPYPNSSKTAGGWIVNYLNTFWPRQTDRAKKLDYRMMKPEVNMMQTEIQGTA